MADICEEFLNEGINVILYEQYSNDIEWLRKAVASKLEPTSAIMVEGMMKGKVCICSDICGVCYYLENEKNAFIFKSQDSRQLAEKITYVINNYDYLNEVRENGRRVYENIYSEKVFRNNIEKIFSL